MTEEPDPADASPALPALKVVEPEVDAEIPWGDDVLDRKEIARRLTSVVWEQEAPFVISVDGRWGTGKTFLLKRWAQDLRNQDPPWQVIYYNAWEDDFAQDPLLAIISQLSEHLSEGFGDRVSKLVEVAGPLLYYGASLAALVGVGIPLPPIPTGSDDSPSEKLDAYQKKRAAKDDLRESLGRLASEVRKETGQPLIFIIDELDRCRPTFAIELLERVKHVFDVPNIVFVFGINRGELTKSLRSVYGEIDAGTYLRRFFDMEFVLPDADPERFCASLVRRFQLDTFFLNLSKAAGSDTHVTELRLLSSYLPVIVGRLGLSLRDIDYCIRLLALATRDLSPRQTLHPALFVALVAVKIENPDLYRRFIAGGARGAEVVDYMNGLASSPYAGSGYSGRDVRRILTNVEAALYCADDAEVAQKQIERLSKEMELDRPEYLSAEISRVNPAVEGERIEQMADLVRMYARDTGSYGIGRGYLAGKIDIHFGFVRR